MLHSMRPRYGDFHFGSLYTKELYKMVEDVGNAPTSSESESDIISSILIPRAEVEYKSASFPFLHLVDR